MAEIELINLTLVALVDDVDVELVSAFRWSAYRMGRSGTMYAVSGTPRVYMHRLVSSAPDGFDVDHINGNGIDNRRENLRVCPHALNLANQRTQTRPKTSRYKGVSYAKRQRGSKKWNAYIKVDRVKKNIGYYATEREAALAYNAAAVAAWGEYARPNILDLVEAGQ